METVNQNPGFEIRIWLFRILLFITISAIGCISSLEAREIEGVLSRGKTYSLPDLYRIALKRSEAIQISRENLYISEMDRERALSALIPRLSGFGTYTRYSERKTHDDSVTQPEWTISQGLNLNQSFTLNGREFIAFKVAEDTIVRNKHELHAVREEYLLGVASAYFDVLKAAGTAEIAESNVERLEKHKESVSVRLELEDVPKTELFRTEAELSQAKTDLIGAENDTRLAKVNLASIVGIPGIYQTRGPGVLEYSPEEPDLEALIAGGLENRAELKSLRLEKTIAEEMVKISKSDYWPMLSAEAGYRNREQESAPDGMVKHSVYAELTLNIELYDGGLRSAELKQALARKRQASLAVRELEKRIAVEIEEAYLELNTHKSVIKSLRDQLDFSRENYNAVTKQFRHGLANSVDVMDANTLLVTSQMQLLESRYDHQLAVLKLERARGIFLKTIVDHYIH